MVGVLDPKSAKQLGQLKALLLVRCLVLSSESEMVGALGQKTVQRIVNSLAPTMVKKMVNRLAPMMVKQRANMSAVM